MKTQGHDIEQDMDKMREKGKEVKNAMYDKADEAKEKIGKQVRHSYNEAKAMFSHMPGDVVEYVKTNPYKAVGLSMLIGVAIAGLLRR
jgi:ElaB/YqjD/DUF883 family membrane-anchored ribosome-binding protein